LARTLPPARPLPPDALPRAPLGQASFRRPGRGPEPACLAQEGVALTGKRWLALCCALLAGCATSDTIADRVRVPNLLGTPFRDRQEVLDHIPVGTHAEQARAVMRAHGFDEWSGQRQGDQL